MKSIRIGNGCGFWGDNLDAPAILARTGQLDYLTLEYLAELTMSILAKLRQREPQTGYATDFIDVLDTLGPLLTEQPQLRIITNAGGMNPWACAMAAARKTDRQIAVVDGDDLLPRLDELLASGHDLAHLDTGEPLLTIRPRVVSANAYLGARPIAEALGLGAAIVITGRVADAALTLGPAVYELGWSWTDWDRLAGGVVAGHLIECGAQATGGLWPAWAELDLADVGYPIAILSADGSTVLTKPDGSSGVVNVETTSEQLLYEVGDPAAYLTPDVVADFTSLRLSQVGTDAVRLENSRGLPATDFYKVSIAYRDGFAASGMLVVAGPQAVSKARECGEIVRKRLARANAEPRGFYVEVLGSGDSLPGVLPAVADPPEVVLRIHVQDDRKAVVERFSRELAPLVTSGPPGVTGYTTGRPIVREVLAYWPALIAKSAVTPRVRLYETDQ